jgi:hypothetical protein
MKTLSCKRITPLLVWASVPFLLAAAVPIGIVVSDGHLKVNNLEVAGNATVVDGSSVQTGGASSSIRLNNGARIVFGADSRGTLSSDRLVLERGSAKIAGYSVQANTLKINADQNSSATIGLHGKVVEVAALAGNIHIFNAGGVNVANLLPGDAVNLQPQESGASAPSSLTGCVTKTGDAFLLTDTTSKVKVVLHGQNLTAGQKIQVSGRLVSEPNSKPDAPKGLEILTMKVLAGGCTSAAKGAAAAGSSATGAGTGAGGAAAAAGSAVSWTVIAGVGVAAAGTAIGIAVTQSSGSSLSDGR